jgi:hypothetical protein
MVEEALSKSERLSFKRWGSWKASQNAGTTGRSATMNMPSATGKPWREGWKHMDLAYMIAAKK